MRKKAKGATRSKMATLTWGGGPDLEFAMDSKALGRGGTRDAFPARQLYPRRVQFWNATRSKRAPLGWEGVKLERDTFQSGILE
jgi:hypothetical protein